MKDRIIEFLVKENITPAEFADKIGVQRSSVSHVLNGRNFPGASFLQKILSNYKNLNPRWLLLGEGSMLEIKNSSEPSLFSVASEDNSSLEVPLLKISSKKNGESDRIVEEAEIKTEINFPQPSVNKVKEESTQKAGKSLEEKEVETIVLFYTDKTFSIYTPAK